MKRWSVPFITETTDIYEVEAGNRNQAVMLATVTREKCLDALRDGKSTDGVAPTHSHVTKFQLGVVRETVSDPSKVAGGEGNL